MGVNSCSHFFAWLIESVGFLLITITILVIILKFGNILPKTNGFILFLYFSDYSFSVIAMSYLISVFFNNTNIAALIGSLIYVIAFFPFIVLITVEDELSYVVKVFVVSQLSEWLVFEKNGPLWFVFKLSNWKFSYLNLKIQRWQNKFKSPNDSLFLCNSVYRTSIMLWRRNRSIVSQTITSIC